MQCCLDECQCQHWHDLNEATPSDKELTERLQKYFDIILTISGFLAGFTFLVTNTKVEYVYPVNASQDPLHGMTRIQRGDIFGTLTILAFVLSLGSVLSAIILKGYLNFVGETNVRWFLKSFYMLFDVPLTFGVLGLFCMLAGSVVNIRGFYSDIVLWIGLGVGCPITACILGTFCCVRMRSHHKVKEGILKKNYSKFKSDPLHEI
eukprot:TRINITY_DN11570_c0_g2_i1.p1 TRINITY_DN11570_c0_g2~~TRINITY_DN11570_c0_g2_i1.p1  ORF type:complete len:206 (+),score=29.36 TRINITY_DN11570_c0_g2_i1:137-754(+)